MSKNLTINVAGFQNDSVVDGPGIRFAVFAQGCSHNCEGCHNPQTHEFGIGQDYSVYEIVENITHNPLIKGVTFTGGDPFFQAEAFAELARLLRPHNYEIACYTGFAWEEINASRNPAFNELLSNLDVLIDGRFILKERTLELPFKGSSNQRFIDVKKSLFTKKLATFPKWSHTFFYDQ